MFEMFPRAPAWLRGCVYICFDFWFMVGLGVVPWHNHVWVLASAGGRPEPMPPCLEGPQGAVSSVWGQYSSVAEREALMAGVFSTVVLCPAEP